MELRADIERLADDWDQAGRNNDYLLRGARLAEVEELGDAYLHELGAVEQDYVLASRTLEAAELERARRATRRLRRLTVGLAAFLAMLS